MGAGRGRIVRLAGIAQDVTRMRAQALAFVTRAVRLCAVIDDA